MPSTCPCLACCRQKAGHNKAGVYDVIFLLGLSLWRHKPYLCELAAGLTILSHSSLKKCQAHAGAVPAQEGRRDEGGQ